MINKELVLGKQVENVGIKDSRGCLRITRDYKCLNCKKDFRHFCFKKFCCQKCYGKSKIGEKHSWGNKIGDALRGKPKSKSHKEKVAKILQKMRDDGLVHLLKGKNHHAWKGDNVSYGSLHDWVSRHKGRPKKCEECKLEDLKRMYHWANISGTYKRDLNDWRRLCVSCHRKMDKNIAKATIIYKYDKKTKCIKSKI